MDPTMKTKKRRVRKNKKAKQDEAKTKINKAVKKVKKGKIALCKICNLKLIENQIHSCRPKSDSLVIQCALCDRRFKCKKYLSMHTVVKHEPRSLLKLSLFRLRKLIQPSKKNLKSNRLLNEIAEKQGIFVNILDDSKLMSYKCTHCTRYYKYEKDLANHIKSEHTAGRPSMINKDKNKDQMKQNNDINLYDSPNGPSTSSTMIIEDEIKDQMKQNCENNLNRTCNMQTTHQDDNNLIKQNSTVNEMRMSEYKEKNDVIILVSPMHSPNPNQTENVATEESKQIINDWPENTTVHERSDQTLSLYRTECLVCNQYFLHYEELIRHMKTDHIRHVCLLCKRTFTMRYQLFQHMSWIHNVTIVQNKWRPSNYKNNPNYKYADVKVQPSWSGESNVKVEPSWSGESNVKVKPSWSGGSNVKVEPSWSGGSNVKVGPSWSGESNVKVGPSWPVVKVEPKAEIDDC